MQKLAIGIVRKTHGVKGYLRVKSLSGETEHFLKLKTVFIKRKQEFESYRVGDVKSFSPYVLMKLEGIDTPEEGKKLCGIEIWVDRKHANPLRVDEYYISDLNRCRVFYREKLIGDVKSLIETGVSYVLEVECSPGNVVMIPLVKKFIDKVEIESQRIILNGEDFLSSEIPHTDTVS